MDTIREAFIADVAGVTQSLRAQANFIASQAANSNQTFPFVTIGTFEVEGLSVRISSKVEGTVFTPLLEPTASAIRNWNDYSVKAQNWVTESRQTFEASPDALSDSFSPADKSSFITPILTAPNDEGKLVPKEATSSADAIPIAPLWQMSPPPYDASSTINKDLLAYPEMKTLYQAMTKAREGVFGTISELESLAGSFARTLTQKQLREGDFLHGDKSAALLTNSHRALSEAERDDDHEDNRYHPVSVFMQPVFSDIFDPQSKIIGVLHAIVQWDAFMVGLLPPTVDGIRVVLRNNCDQAYTYEVNGPNAVFVGAGESRNEKYENDHFRFDLPFQRLEFPEATPNVDGHCSYTFSIYPTVSLSTYVSRL